MAKVPLRYIMDELRLPPEAVRRIKKLALPPDVAQQLREKFADLPPDLAQRLKRELPAGWDILPDVVRTVEEAAAQQKPAEAAPAVKPKTKKPQPQSQQARWALRRLFPDGRLPPPAELGTKALQQKIAEELKREPKAEGTPHREPPSWDVVDRVRKEPLS
jgi:hypothetical protein